MTEWKEYTGSYEQIAEIEAEFMESGFIVMKENGGISEIIQGSQPLSKGFVSHNFNHVWRVKKYLVCNPHLLADMICQQARTGQPVWVRVSYYDPVTDINGAVTHKTTTPDWNIPNAEYSFDEFKEEVWLLG